MKKIITFLAILLLCCSCETETKNYIKEVDLEDYIHGFSWFSTWSMEKHDYESALDKVDFAKSNPELFQLKLKQKRLKEAKENYKEVLEKQYKEISSIVKTAEISNGRKDTVLCEDFSLGKPIFFHYEITEIKIKNLEYAINQLNRFKEELKELNNKSL